MFKKFSLTISEKLAVTFRPVSDASFDDVLARLAKTTGQMSLSRERTAERAYHFWIDEGRNHGRDVAHWLSSEGNQRSSELDIRQL